MMIQRKSVIVAIVLLTSIIGVAEWLGGGERPKSVPLKGKWPSQGLNPIAIFDDDFELSVKNGRVHFTHGNNIDFEATRIFYDRASDLLTLEGLAIEEGKDTPVMSPKVVIVVHPHRQQGPRKTLGP
jgi:hypothetical protein